MTSDEPRDENMAEESAPAFSMAISQNRYLMAEDDEMHAVLTVTATGGAGVAAPEVAEVIAIDCSGSMSYPSTKLTAAQRATRAAIDALRDGALFAVIEGTDTARLVYPTTRQLVRANPSTRKAAKQAVQRLRATGGTRMSKWLRLARGLLAEHPTAVRHVILLTDGQNDPGDGQLEAELSRCAPLFTCDARGIGADWEKRELLRIAAALHGTADAVREPADLSADFAAMTRAAMSKLIPEVVVVVKTMTQARIEFLRQTFPTDNALAGTEVDARTTAFSTGSWGAETREFHLRLTLDSSTAVTDEDIRVARVDLRVTAPGTTELVTACPPVSVLAHWTEDLKLSSVLDPKVAHYTDQGELGRAIMRGCDAHDAGDLVTAALDWGKAVALATALGNESALVRLLRLVDVVGDPADGVVRLKDSLAAGDLLSAAMGSVVSSMSPDRPAPAPPAPTSAQGEVTCPGCGRVWPARARFCGDCRAVITT